VKETTALGAAYLAGLAEGVWSSPAEAASSWSEETVFTPSMATEEVERQSEQWHRAVERARAWASDDA